MYRFILDPVYTVPNPLGHDIKTSVAVKPMVILQNLITTNHRKSGQSKNHVKLTEIIVVTTLIRYHVNGVLEPCFIKIQTEKIAISSNISVVLGLFYSF